MPSEKREHKKKSHRRRGKKYSRSTEEKAEGKRSRYDKELTKGLVSEIDISNYVNDPDELVSRVFACLGESYIAEATPRIFKSLKQLELKKLCLRELAVLSNEAVVGIMHGLNPENIDSSMSKHSGISSPSKNLRKSIDVRSQRKRKKHDRARKDRSSDLDFSSGFSLESSSDETSSSGDDCLIIKQRRYEKENRISGEGTSSHYTLSSSYIPMDDSAQISPVTEPDEWEAEIYQEDVNISDVCKAKESADGNLQIINPEEHEVDKNDDSESLPEINVAFLQPVPEVTELEYRARAIRSMIANIDKINEKSFERNSIE